MTDNLRDRIAAVIHYSCEKLAKELLLNGNPMDMATCYRLADEAISAIPELQKDWKWLYEHGGDHMCEECWPDA